MTWDELRTRRVGVPDHVVYRALGQETVLLNMRTSTYHSVDEIGAAFLETLLGSPSAEVACAELATRYDVPEERIAQDMVGFADAMLERELITVDGAPTRPA